MMNHYGLQCFIDSAWINEQTEPAGVIYIKHYDEAQKVLYVPVCTRCWNRSKGDTIPVRVQWHPVAR